MYDHNNKNPIIYFKNKINLDKPQFAISSNVYQSANIEKITKKASSTNLLKVEHSLVSRRAEHIAHNTALNHKMLGTLRQRRRVTSPSTHVSDLLDWRTDPHRWSHRTNWAAAELAGAASTPLTRNAALAPSLSAAAPLTRGHRTFNITEYLFSAFYISIVAHSLGENENLSLLILSD